jgi:hypothetical protein
MRKFNRQAAKNAKEKIVWKTLARLAAWRFSDFSALNLPPQTV